MKISNIILSDPWNDRHFPDLMPRLSAANDNLHEHERIATVAVYLFDLIQRLPENESIEALEMVSAFTDETVRYFRERYKNA